MSNDVQTPVAPVVAVVVSHDSGPAFDELLDSLARQDLPGLTVLILDSAGRDDLPARVGTRLPGAFIRRCADLRGFGPTANEALRLVEGDSGFFCFMHDDVALDRDAISTLAEEALRSNAAIAGPKLVAWDDPTRLVSTGYVADKFGELYPLCDPGELDQEQHDAVRDVFALASACLLVRADLFRAVGGFDPAMELAGEERDLCWRTHVAGGRVIVVPEARARHVGGLAATGAALALEASEERNRLRTVFGCYSAFHLLRVVPQLVIVTALQIVAALVTGRFRRARALASAWPAAVAQASSIAYKRRAVAGSRQVPDGDLRRLQMHGSARMLAFLRRRSAPGASGLGRLGIGGQRAASEPARLGRRAGAGGLVAVAALVVYALFGARDLVTKRVPAVGSLVSFSGSARDALRVLWGGWWDTGLGRPASLPPGLGVLALLSSVTTGNLAALRTVIVVASLVLGPMGAWHIARPFASRLSRWAALIAYAGAPLGVNAIARGHLAGIVAFALAPWMAAKVFGIGAIAPFAPTRSRVASSAALALLIAASAAIAPATIVVTIAIALALAVASLVAGSFRRSAVALGLTVIVTAAAALVLLPWHIVRTGPGWGLGTLASGADHQSFLRLVRFATGPHGSVPFGFAVAIAAVVAVIVARGEELGWVVRGIVLAGAALVVAAAASSGHLGARPPEIEVLLAPALVGVALIAAAGTAAFEREVRGKRFSWRQPAAFVAGASVVMAALAALLAAGDGRFGLPARDLVQPLRFLPAASDGVGERLLWIGAPRDLPPGAWPLGRRLGYALTDRRGPQLVDLWRDEPRDGERQVAADLALVADGQTDRVGHLLAPAGVRFIVIPSASARPPERIGGSGGFDAAPAGATGDRTSAAPGDGATDASATATNANAAADLVPAASPALLAGLASQLDLRRVTLDAPIIVYENTAWLAITAQLDDVGRAASRLAGADVLVRSDLTGATPVLATGAGRVDGRGDVAAGTVYVSRTFDRHWSLHVDGHAVKAEPAFGWATAFTVSAGGVGALGYGAPLLHRLALVLELVGVLILVRLAWSAPRRVRSVARHADGGLAAVVPIGRGTAGVPEDDDSAVALRHALDLPDEIALRWADDVKETS